MTNQTIQTYICEIKEILNAFAVLKKVREQLRDKKWQKGWTPWWTEKIIRYIGAAGRRHCFEVYSESDRHNFSKDKGWYRTNKSEVDNDKGQWSYDLCWVKEHDELTGSLPLTRSLPLALECEWKPDRFEIEFDFEKLLWSCASLRVMIFHRWDKRANFNTIECKAEEEIYNLIRRIKAFSGCQSEAKYLFCVHCTYKNGNKFIFRCYPDEGGQNLISQ